MANLREEQDLSKHEVGQYWQSSSLGNLDYIPQEALENLEWYPTFWDDMEKIENVIKLDESMGERKTQEINQQDNIDTSLPNHHQRICSHCEAKETTQKPLGRTKVKSCSIKRRRTMTVVGENTLCNACGLRYKLNC